MSTRGQVHADEKKKDKYLPIKDHKISLKYGSDLAAAEIKSLSSIMAVGAGR